MKLKMELFLLLLTHIEFERENFMKVLYSKSPNIVLFRDTDTNEVILVDTSTDTEIRLEENNFLFLAEKIERENFSKEFSWVDSPIPSPIKPVYTFKESSEITPSVTIKPDSLTISYDDLKISSPYSTCLSASISDSLLS